MLYCIITYAYMLLLLYTNVGHGSGYADPLNHLHLHLQDTKQCLDRPLYFGNTSAQRRERLKIKL